MTKINYLYDLFNRLVKIDPDREYYNSIECDNKYARKEDYNKLLAKVAIFLSPRGPAVSWAVKG